MTRKEAVFQIEDILEYFEDRIEKETDPAFDKDIAKKDAEALRMAIKALEQEPKWTPVSERLPEEREWYLVVFKEKDTGFQLVPRVADYIGNGDNKWRTIDEVGLCQEYRDILECIAWMPLPAPFKPQESEG